MYKSGHQRFGGAAPLLVGDPRIVLGIPPTSSISLSQSGFEILLVVEERVYWALRGLAFGSRCSYGT